MNYARLTALAWLALLLGACGQRPKPAAGLDPVTTLRRAHKLEGKVVLVEFGTIGCELSDKGLDAMTDWHRRNAIPALSYLRLEAATDKATRNGYYGQKSVPFPVATDSGLVISGALGTTVYPSFALLDKFGRVRYRGRLPGETELAEWVGKLAVETADAGPDAPLFGATTTDAPGLLAATRLPDLNGSLKPLAEYSGAKGILLVFADTKCPFSAAAARELPVVASGLAGHDITTVLVNIGDPEPTVKTAYAAGIAGTAIVYDAGKQTQEAWKVQFVPTVFLLDKAGSAVYRGSPVWAKVASALADHLGLPAGSVSLDAQGTTGG